MTARPWRSGWCNRSNPPESHKRCLGQYLDDRANGRGAVPCGCDCHQEPTHKESPGAAPDAARQGEAQAMPDQQTKGGTDIEPGLHFDLDEKEYHSHRGSLSHSGAKTLLRAPALFRWEQDHPVYKDVFDFGHAAHAKVLGVGAKIVVVHADDWRSKAAREARDAARAEGKTPLLAKDAAKVDDMAAELLRHRLAAQLLTSGRPEVSAFCEDPATGVLRRSRFDWVEDRGILVDYKTTVCSEPNAFVRSSIKYGYHSQHAWYLDIGTDLDLSPTAFAFIAQEKEPPYLVTVIELPADLVEHGRARNRRALERFRDCTDSGHWPGYVPDTTFATPTAPPWGFRDEEYDAA